MLGKIFRFFKNALRRAFGFTMAKKSKRRVVPLAELGWGGDFMEHVDSPLSCALVGGAYIENALGSLLTQVLIDDSKDKEGSITDRLLNGHMGTLANYAARADICYCLGLLTKPVYKNARAIGGIRNRFAHRHEAIDFNDDEVKRLCGEIKLPEIRDQRGDLFEPIAYARQMDPTIDFDEADEAIQKLILAVTVTHMYIKSASTRAKKLTPIECTTKCMTKGVMMDDPSVIAPVIFFNVDNDGTGK